MSVKTTPTTAGCIVRPQLDQPKIVELLSAPPPPPPLPPLQMVPSTQISESLQPISPLHRKKWTRNRFLFRVAPIMPAVENHGPFGAATFRLSAAKTGASGSLEDIPRSVFGGSGIQMPRYDVHDLSVRPTVGSLVASRSKSFAIKVNICEMLKLFLFCIYIV